MSEYDYDVLVIGSGPSGQRAAIQSAKLHKRVAVVECKAVVGGVCVNSGTIPSKTMREAVLHLSGYRYRNLYGQSYTVKQNITIADLLFRTGHVVNNEIEVMRHQLMRNDVELIIADASFIDPDTVRQVRTYARTRFPSLAGAPVVETRVCQYETTPDTEFILDRHPDLTNVWIAGGGSGHAFKHGPVIGSYLVSRLAGAPASAEEARFSLTRERRSGSHLRTGAPSVATASPDR